MHLLMTLLLAHLFADFPLQTNRLAQWKRSSLNGVLIHVFIYIVVTALLLQQPLYYWPLIIGLGVVHFIIDAIKVICNIKDEVRWFVIDQCLHFTTVIGAVYLSYQFWSPLPVGILPNGLLHISFIGAFTLAVMVLFWVWANGLSEDQLKQNTVLCWIKHQMLTLEQRTGLILIALVFVGQLLIG